jgi:hypothetical protein
LNATLTSRANDTDTREELFSLLDPIKEAIKT